MSFKDHKWDHVGDFVRYSPLPTTREKRKKVAPVRETAPAKWLREPSEAAYYSAHPGHPLGPGMPTGRTLRLDGETHRDAWKRILRSDPCAYCDRPSLTIDHIIPASSPTTGGPGGLHSWSNYTGACESCNWSKSDVSLLVWLSRRRGAGRHAVRSRDREGGTKW